MRPQKCVLRFIALEVVVLIILLSGCSKDDETGPDDHSDPPPATSVMETIGTEGGKIELDSIVLTIPPGSFSEDHTLTLAVESNPVTSMASAVTGAFKLEGLPGEFSIPIGLKLKYGGTIEGHSFIARGSSLYSSYLDTTVFKMSLIPITDSSGYLLGTLMPFGKNKKSSQKGTGFSDIIYFEELLLYLMGIDGLERTQSRYFDTIIYTSSLDPVFVKKVGDHLDDIYELFTAAGFNQEFYPGFKLPVGRIDVFDERASIDREPWMKDDPLTSSNPFLYLFHQPDFTLWTTTYFSDEELRQMIGNEYFKQFLFYIDPRDCYSFNDRTPFNNSVLHWLEEKWTLSGDPGNYVPSCFSEPDFKIYLDLFSRGSTNCEVIEYLVEKYGEAIIRRHYMARKNGSSLFPAVAHCVDDPIRTWLPEYFKSLFLEEIYPGTKSVFIQKIFDSPDYTFKQTLPSSNSTRSYIASHGDLSARIYYFQMDHPDITENSLLSFSISSNELSSDDLNGFLFTIDPYTEEISFVKEGTDIQIADPLNYKEVGLDIFIVITNSYYADEFKHTCEIRLDATHTEAEQLNFSRMRITLDSVNYIRHYQNGREYLYENQAITFTVPQQEEYKGSFSKDDIFSAGWEYMNGYINKWGEVNATVQSDPWILAEFDFTTEDRFQDVSGALISVQKERMTGINFPLERSPGYMGSRVNGQDILQYMNILEILFYYIDPAMDQDFGFQLEDLTITEDSFLEIYFFDEN
jgi:hypothetical protein